MRNPTRAGATVQEVEKEVMLWLRGSADREGGRRRREVRPIVQPAAEDDVVHRDFCVLI